MPRPDEPPSAGAHPTEPPSKTRRKAAMHALQDLGEALVRLDPARLAELGLPERLADAITQARAISAHEGRRRQMQFIGKLMREIDPEPVRAALDRWAAGIPSDKAQFAAAERWREDLLRDDAAVERFVAEHPAADRVTLATLVGEARGERARGGPPHRYRELFRRLKSAMSEDVPDAPSPDAAR